METCYLHLWTTISQLSYVQLAHLAAVVQVEGGQLGEAGKRSQPCIGHILTTVQAQRLQLRHAFQALQLGICHLATGAQVQCVYCWKPASIHTPWSHSPSALVVCLVLPYCVCQQPALGLSISHAKQARQLFQLVHLVVGKVASLLQNSGIHTTSESARYMKNLLSVPGGENNVVIA